MDSPQAGQVEAKGGGAGLGSTGRQQNCLSREQASIVFQSIEDTSLARPQRRTVIQKLEPNAGTKSLLTTVLSTGRGALFLLGCRLVFRRLFVYGNLSCRACPGQEALFLPGC